MNVIFVELPAFTRECLEVAGDDELRAFQHELAVQPESGDLIQGTGGLRKARFKMKGRGKSGSARVIYLWLPRSSVIIMFQFYTKQTKSDLSPAEKKALRTAVQIIKEHYRHEQQEKADRD